MSVSPNPLSRAKAVLITMKVLLVEPEFYTQYPPLGLLKLASYHRSRGSEVKLVRGLVNLSRFDPDLIEVTSLFTYSWKPVHDAIAHYRSWFPAAAIRVGGIYASLMPARIRRAFPKVETHHSVFAPAECYLPAYDLLEGIERWKGWSTSILFTTRGCIRKCPFCVVPQIEGRLRTTTEDLQQFIHPDHTHVTIWDNNFLASPRWKESLAQLRDIGLKVDFNQGLDARLIDEEKADMLADLRLPMIRMAYDSSSQRGAIARAVNMLSASGVRRRDISFYLLFNFYNPATHSGDRPEGFLDRLRYVAKLGCVSYPMRYEPPDSLTKNCFVSPYWTADRLELVAKARRVIGFGGAFPPYEGLVKKFNEATSFDEAFSLREQARQSPGKMLVDSEPKMQSILINARVARAASAISSAPA